MGRDAHPFSEGKCESYEVRRQKEIARKAISGE
jgi:hypothetical protein